MTDDERHVPDAVPRLHQLQVHGDASLLTKLRTRARVRRRRRFVSGGFALACVAAIGAVSTVLASSGTSNASGQPGVAVASTTPAPTPTDAEPSVEPTPEPSLSDSGSPTPAPSESSPPPITLVTGPYGFDVPQGWDLKPLTNYGGPGSYAVFSESPNAISQVNYMENGGSFGQMYTSDPTPQPNPTGFTGGFMGGVVCQLTSVKATGSNTARFACTAPDGYVSIGAVVVDPIPKGFRALEVTLPRSQSDDAVRILDSFR